MNENSLQLVKYDNVEIPSGYLLGEISAETTLKYLKSLGASDEATDLIKDIEVSRILYKAVLKAAKAGQASPITGMTAVSPKGVNYGAGTGKPIPGYVLHMVKNGNPPEGWQFNYGQEENSESLGRDYLSNMVTFYESGGEVRYIASSEEHTLSDKDRENIIGKESFEDTYIAVQAAKHTVKEEKATFQETLKSTGVNIVEQEGKVHISPGKNYNVLANFVLGISKVTGNTSLHEAANNYLAKKGKSPLVIDLREALTTTISEDGKVVNTSNGSKITPELLKEVYEILGDPNKDYLAATAELDSYLQSKGLITVAYNSSEVFTTGKDVLDKTLGLESVSSLMDIASGVEWAESVKAGVISPEQIKKVFPKLGRYMKDNLDVIQNGTPEDLAAISLGTDASMFQISVTNISSMGTSIYELAKGCSQAVRSFNSINAVVKANKKKAPEMTTLSVATASFLVKSGESTNDVAARVSTLLSTSGNTVLPEDIEESVSKILDALRTVKIPDRNDPKMYDSDVGVPVKNKLLSMKGQEAILLGHITKALYSKVMVEGNKDYAEIWPTVKDGNLRSIQHMGSFISGFIPTKLGSDGISEGDERLLSDMVTSLVTIATYSLGRFQNKDTMFNKGVESLQKALSVLGNSPMSIMKLSTVLKSTPLQEFEGKVAFIPESGKVKVLTKEQLSDPDTRAEILESLDSISSTGDMASSRSLLASIALENPELIPHLTVGNNEGVSIHYDAETQKSQETLSDFMSGFIKPLDTLFSKKRIQCALGANKALGDEKDKQVKALMESKVDLINKVYSSNDPAERIELAKELTKLLPDLDSSGPEDAKEDKDKKGSSSKKKGKSKEEPKEDALPEGQTTLFNRISMIPVHEAYLKIMSNEKLLEAYLTGDSTSFLTEATLGTLGTVSPDGKTVIPLSEVNIEKLTSLLYRNNKPVIELDLLMKSYTFSDAKETPTSRANKQAIMKKFVVSIISAGAKTEVDRLAANKTSRLSVSQPSETFESLTMLTNAYNMLRGAGTIEEAQMNTVSMLQKNENVDLKTSENIHDYMDQGFKVTDSEGTTHSIGLRASTEKGSFCDAFIHKKGTDGKESLIPLEFKMVSEGYRNAHYNAISDPCSMFGRVFSKTQGLTVEQTLNVTTVLDKDSSYRGDVYPIRWHNSLNVSSLPDTLDLEGVRGHAKRLTGEVTNDSD